jgi:hypothetical protein
VEVHLILQRLLREVALLLVVVVVEHLPLLLVGRVVRREHLLL